MQSINSSQTWTGALRLVPLIVATILLFSIVTLGLSTAYGKQMAHAPLDSYQTAHPGAYPYTHRWPNTYFVFYSGTMPFLTILQSATDSILYFTVGLNQIYALTAAILFLCGWAIQVGFWASCDIFDNSFESAEGTCYQSNIQRSPDGSSLLGLTNGLGDAKVAFGIFLLILYLTYMSFAAAAVHKHRAQRKLPQIDMKVLVSSEEGSTA